MANVAVIEFSQQLIDISPIRPSVTISEDNICTITFQLVAANKRDDRDVEDDEKWQSRDAKYADNLVKNNPNDVRVKLVPTARGKERATLIIEADIDLKIPGTGSFLHPNDEYDKVNEGYAAQ
jgi:hypothetical protein